MGALADINRSIEIDPGLTSGWFNRAVVMRDKGELPRAIADYNRCIEIHPRNADAFAQRGLTRLLQGYAVEAERDFAYCLSLNPALQISLEQLIKQTKQQMAERVTR
jgi:tetratricopeptide (TPR) repeat protein